MCQCWEEQGEWPICRGAGCKLLWCGTVAAALCSISCPMLGVKNSSCVAQAVSLKGNQGWMRGCSLCLGYRDGAWWGYGVTGHRGRSPSLCRCVQQPCEYSGCVLSPDAATQCANLFQICQGVEGEVWTSVQEELVRCITRALCRQSGDLPTDGTDFHSWFDGWDQILTCDQKAQSLTASEDQLFFTSFSHANTKKK